MRYSTTSVSQSLYNVIPPQTQIPRALKAYVNPWVGEEYKIPARPSANHFPSLMVIAIGVYMTAANIHTVSEEIRASFTRAYSKSLWHRCERSEYERAYDSQRSYSLH